jgi:3-oxoacyl-[acyl-carrier-protein] synthase II
VVQAWGNLRALSTRNETPETACRPFSGDRDGMVLGEGAAVLVLEAASHAVARGAKIYAEVRGYAATSDSHHITHPNQDGPARAMKLALADSGVKAASIDYISAHGTGTIANDKNETAAIRAVFGPHADNIPVVSTKGALGHSIAASGALELVACVLALQDQRIPPTINYTTPDPACDLDYVTTGSRNHPIQLVMSNSFAFGGANAALILSPFKGLS